MPPPHVRNFSDPDEVIEANRVRSEVVSLFGMTVARDTHMPGWRWSLDVRPVVRTELCEVRHIGYALRGVLRVTLEDGSEFDVGAGEVYHIPPRHDGWVLGDEPFEVLEWVGTRSWITPVGIFGGRVLATMVVTDIVDSTRAAQAMGDHAWKEILAVYESRVRDALTEFRGHEVKQTGDGVLATFDSTARALRCSLALRRVASQLGLRTRTAVHTGEVEAIADDIHGLAVHEVTRMLGLAEPDEILTSATTYQLSDDRSLVYVEKGKHELRGIDGPRQIFALSESQSPEDF